MLNRKGTRIICRKCTQKLICDEFIGTILKHAPHYTKIVCALTIEVFFVNFFFRIRFNSIVHFRKWLLYTEKSLLFKKSEPLCRNCNKQITKNHFKNRKHIVTYICTLHMQAN